MPGMFGMNAAPVVPPPPGMGIPVGIAAGPPPKRPRRGSNTTYFVPQETKGEIPTITLSSPEASPDQPSTSNERRRKNPIFTPPIPDAVHVPPRYDIVVELQCAMQFQFQSHCVCNRPPGMPIICRCPPPYPTLRFSAAKKTFELGGINWMVSTTDCNMAIPVLSTSYNLGIIVSPLEGELLGDAEIEVEGTMTLYGTSNFQQEERRFSYTLGTHKFSRRQNYALSLARNHLSNFTVVPIGNPQFPYPSTATFTARLELTVKSHSNLKKEPKFTLDFTKRGSLANFVIMCGNKPLYVDCQYLAHYSCYFEATCRHMELGMVTKHSSGLYMTHAQSEDYEAFQAILLFCSPCRVSIPTRLLVDCVRLADQYQFYTVKQDAETNLIRLIDSRQRPAGCNYSDLEFLIIAEKFNMEQLKEHAVANVFKSQQAVQQGVSHAGQQFFYIVQNDPNYHKLSPDMKVFLLDSLHTFSLPQLNVFNPSG